MDADRAPQLKASVGRLTVVERTQLKSQRDDEGWRQIRGGVSLVNWSRLARFDAAQLAFHAASEDEFESDSGHRDVHPEFGRLICWIGFSVGAEYLAKGACLLKGKDPTTSTKVIRPPAWNEDLEQWSRLVNSKDPSVRVQDLSLGALGKTPVDSIETLGSEREVVSAAIKFLASTIRNRDLHRYAPNVRAGHFQAVPRLFVPAFNSLMHCLDQREL